MATLLISDLHLEAQRPAIGKHFLQFLDGEAKDADALYILGDLFEVWFGDDDPSPYYAGMKVALRRLTDSGVPTFFMHGNRDFTIGEQFAAETGVSILGDPVVVDLHGHEVLLSHGDALCTDDVEYQQFRLMTRNPDWQAMMLTKSIEERMAYAMAVRQASVARGIAISDEIMDVNQEAVHALLREYNVDTLLHGHTHHPAVHDVDLGDRLATRIVLGDWFEQGSLVRWDENGPSLEMLAR
jgi:UDP-2,3-diacylglucosamine hydrolase